jgi:hypothetical protein
MFRGETGTTHPGEGQQIVDQASHTLGRLGDRFHVRTGAMVERSAGALLEECRKADDVTQRRAQIVRHRIAEGLELAVRHVRAPRYGGARDPPVDPNPRAQLRCWQPSVPPVPRACTTKSRNVTKSYAAKANPASTRAVPLTSRLRRVNEREMSCEWPGTTDLSEVHVYTCRCTDQHRNDGRFP